MTTEARFKVGDLVKINPEFLENSDIQLRTNNLERDVIYVVSRTRNEVGCISLRHPNGTIKNGWECRFIDALTPIEVGDLEDDY